jgi:hypothetical protein
MTRFSVFSIPTTTFIQIALSGDNPAARTTTPTSENSQELNKGILRRK